MRRRRRLGFTFDPCTPQPLRGYYSHYSMQILYFVSFLCERRATHPTRSSPDSPSRPRGGFT